MNRLAGIIVAVIGFLVAVLSVLGVIPGLTSAGVVTILLGGLIIGLSFVNPPDAGDTKRMSTGATIGNIFVAPTEVFQNLRRHPRWLVAALIISLCGSVFANLFLYRLGADRVANYAIDKTLEMSFLNDDAKKQIEGGRKQAIDDAKNPVIRAGQAVSSFAGSVFFMAFLSAVFMLFALAMGGKINFWQAFSATVYAMLPVAIIRFILNTVILFIKDPADIHPIAGQSNLIQDNLNFLLTPADSPVLYTVLGMLGLLWFYWVWLNATGLKNAGERVTPTIAWSASIGVYLLMICLGAIAALLFPSFIS